MTYKAIVKEMVRMEAEKWVMDLLKENNIDYRFTTSTVIDMENDKERDTIFWNVSIEIVLPDYHHINLRVGGTVDDMTGICASAIWHGTKLLWMATEKTRKQLGIEEFKIA